jgi:hypothetical protein
MGKITIVKWQCDRCCVILDKRPGRDGHTPQYAVSALVDYQTAGGPWFDYKELCVECNADVGRELTIMKENADGARRART